MWKYRGQTREVRYGDLQIAANGASQAIRDYYCFYPGRVQCYVAGERVRPQPGEFYGGWVTHELSGPFKGLPGTSSW
jgi:hypothetical protein